MHSIWSGTLSVGLINIPVRLYSGTLDHALNLHMLHKKDLSPIRYARICKEEEKEVPYKEIVKAVEYEKDQYVALNEKDFEQADVKKTNTIEIRNFSLEKEIDTIFFEKPYFLEPGKGADKAYVLLKEALKKSKKVAIATFVLRNQEHLMVLKPYKNGMVLNQLRYVDEIRNIEELNLPRSEKVNQKELSMALKLIDQLTEKFKPQDYKDTYIQSLEKTIQNKVAGLSSITKKGKAPKPTKVYDIMSKLKASLKEPRKRQTRRASVTTLHSKTSKSKK